MDTIKLFFTDTETSGVDPKKHGITQIAGEIGTLTRDGAYHVLNTFNYPVSLFPGDIVDKAALDVQGADIEEVMRRPPPDEVYRQLSGILTNHIEKFDKKDKAFFIAYNSPFDNQFMREFWTKNSDSYFGSWFFNPDICVMRMAAHALKFERHEMQNMKLATVAQKMGIEYDENTLHNAAIDIAITRRIYLMLTNSVHADG